MNLKESAVWLDEDFDIESLGSLEKFLESESKNLEEQGFAKKEAKDAKVFVKKAPVLKKNIEQELPKETLRGLSRKEFLIASLTALFAVTYFANDYLGAFSVRKKNQTNQNQTSQTNNDAIYGYEKVLKPVVAQLDIHSSKLTSGDFVNVLRQKKLDDFAKLETQNKEYLIVVDKSTQIARTYSLELKLVDATPISTGRVAGDKEKEGDLKTPEGIFSVVSKEDSSGWIHDGKFGSYGKYFFRLDAGSWDDSGNFYSKIKSSIGLHGTNQPERLGSPVSEGCVRFSNDKNAEYASKGFLKKGTLVAIIDSNVDSEKNEYEKVVVYDAKK